MNELYMFFGIFLSLSYQNIHAKRDAGYTRNYECLEVCWNNMAIGNTRYINKSSSLPLVTISSIIYHDEKVYPQSVHQDDIILLAKKNSHELSYLNEFIAEEVKQLYYFPTPGGWTSS